MRKLILSILFCGSVCSYMQAQEFVKIKRNIPSNNANNAIGEKSAVWRNIAIAPPASNNFPNQQNWWSIYQTQFGDARYDAQLAFGLNEQDLWLRYNFNGDWRDWKKVMLANKEGQLLENIGLGTSATEELLTINGNVKMLGSDKNIEWFTSTWDKGFGHKIYSHDPGGKTLLKIAARHNKTDWSDMMTFTSDGKIGVGTTNPSAKFELFGGGNLLIKGRDNDAGDLIFHSNTAKQLGRIWSNSSGVSGLYLSSGDNTVDLAISDKGNIGIGTATPEHKLDVSGNAEGIKLGSTQNNILFRNNVGGSNEIRSYGLPLEIETRNTQDIFFNSNNGVSKLMVIKGNGEGVGIGTTSPDAKLTVNGNIHAKEVKIDLSIPAPDYVFKSDYNLRNIEEVERFIDENSHLPEIPSAKEFAENGVMVASMSMSLLKKVEELTLYTIQQQKQLKAQDAKIEALTKENTEVKLLNAKLLDLQSRLERLEAK